MHRTKLILSLAICLAALVPTVARSAFGAKRTNGFPIVVSVSPTSAHPDDSLSVTVYLSQTCDSDQIVSLSANDPTMLTNLPPTMTVLAGHASGSFNTTVSSTASGSLSITATANGHSASSAAPIID